MGVGVDRVASPYMAGTARDVVGKLLLGQWLIFDHQWGRSGPDPALWQEIVQEACESQGVPVAFIAIPRHDLTVVVNPQQQPTFDQVRESVDAMLHHRFTGTPIPSEVVAKTGSENPLATDRARHRLR
jgi:hypothetical protein